MRGVIDHIQNLIYMIVCSSKCKYGLVLLITEEALDMKNRDDCLFI